MNTIKRYKIKFTVIISCLLLLVGCKTTSSKYGTAMDMMKEDLRVGIQNNCEIKKVMLPSVINDSLMPDEYEKNEQILASINFPKEKFNVVAENVPAKSFFLGLVEGSNINVIMHPGVSGAISLKVKDVTIPDVLRMIDKVYGYGFEVQGNNSVKVFPATLQSKTFKVNYIDLARDGTSITKVKSSSLEEANNNNNDSSSNDSSSNSSSDSSSSSAQNSKITTVSKADFWTELRVTLEKIIGTDNGRKVAVSPMTSQVVIIALPDEIRKVEKFLRESELTLNRQVILEAKILEVELNDGYRAGINWGLISGRLTSSQYAQGGIHGTNFPEIESSAGQNWGNNYDLTPSNYTATAIANSAFGGVLSLGFNYKKFAAFVDLLNSQGNVQVLSSPRISTTNGQKALIKVGREEFFVTDVTTTTTVTGAGSVPTVTPSFDSFFSGIALDVTPNIDENGYVTLHVHPTISEVSGDKKELTVQGIVTAGSSNPTTTTQEYPLAKNQIRESDTIIRAKNGELVVIGGLMQDSNKEVITGIPWLMNMPFIGSLFRHTRQVAKKSELVILMRPIVVEANSWNKQLEKEYDRFNSLDRGFHVGGLEKVFGNEGECGW